MKSSTRWLVAFGVAIGVLVIAVIVLVLALPKAENAPLLPEDTPDGVVQRYLLALQKEDYMTAYSYLSFPPDKTIPYEQWRGADFGYGEKQEARVTLGKSAVKDSEATVEVTVDTFRPSGPFDDPVRTNHITFFLKKEGTSWKITSPTYVGWFFY